MAKEDLLKGNPATQFKSGQSAIKAAHASTAVRREKKEIKGQLEMAIDIYSAKGKKKALEDGDKEKLENLTKVNSVVLSLLELAHDETVPENTRLKALTEILDRVHGKPIQTVISSNVSDVRNTVIVTKEQLDEEEKEMREALKE